jgi:hemerythrin
MIRYAENHFGTKEGYLERYSYPAYSEQKIAHEAFVGRVFSMARELGEGDLSLGAIVLCLEEV